MLTEKLPKELIIEESLYQRDINFAIISEAENKINQILGIDYPFTTVKLPSTQKKKKKKIKQSKKTVRKLRATEDAYQITYKLDSEIKEEVIRDTKTINALLSSFSPSITIIKITTICIDNDTITNIDSLFESDAK